MTRSRIISLLLLAVLACQPEPVVPPNDDPAEPVEQPEQPGQPETPPENPQKPNPTEVTVGEPLPLWQEGYLDIHSINGGRGESFYYIMPDGTTMLVDAAGAADFETEGEADGSGIYSRPSNSYSSGNVIVQYIKHFAPDVADGHIDYFMTSHYHGDHMGIYTKKFANYGWRVVDKNGTITPSVNLDAGGFLLNGVSEVGYYIPILRIIDRGDWADRPSNVFLTAPLRMQNYLNFIDWSAKKHGTVREKLAIGHNDQIVLKHDAKSYAGFSVRGIAAGGDIQYNGRSTITWKDIDKPISKVVSKVEAMKASHHCAKYANSSDLLIALKPDNLIIGIWTKNQPNPDTMKRFFKASPKLGVFATNLSDISMENLKAEGIDAGSFLARNGHIVLRVVPGGSSYYIYVLDDSDFNYRVLSIHGPFGCN